MIQSMALFLLGACDSSTETIYKVRGVVEAVRLEDSQVIISHEDVPELMPAMTMNFDVENPILLEDLKPGDQIEFELLFNGRAYIIQALDRLGGTTLTSTPLKLASQDDFLPTFNLRNQHGEPIQSDGFRGKVVLIDFIYTSCPGPCPIFTSVGVSARKMLDDIEEEFVFCSITLDPIRDSPEALGEYASKRGAEFENWHFLTSDPESVDALTTELGVARSRDGGDEIEHSLVRFVVDRRGRIRSRLLGANHNAEEISSEIRRVVTASRNK